MPAVVTADTILSRRQESVVANVNVNIISFIVILGKERKGTSFRNSRYINVISFVLPMALSLLAAQLQ